MTPTPTPSNPSAADSAQRVIELEEKLMFSQRALDELNEVVLRQQSELERLNREVQALRTLAERAVELARGADLPHEKPPHY